MKYIQGCEWVEPGFSVKDDNPGTQLFTTGILNTDSSGKYYVDYYAIDLDSNRVTKRRVVNIAPLDFLEVIGEYQAIDTIGPNEAIIKYQSTVSISSSSPLILKIEKLGDSLTAFFSFDSTGFLHVNYNVNDTLIEGIGQYSCDKTKFNLDYYHDTRNFVVQHKATFIKK